MKLVREESKPISGDTGLREIQRLAEEVFVVPNRISSPVTTFGSYGKISNLVPYVDHILGYIKPEELKNLKLVVNAGNGAAGHVIDAIEERLIVAQALLTFRVFDLLSCEPYYLYEQG